MTEKEYRVHPAISRSKLYRMIPESELSEKLSYGDSELEIDFLGFEENYIPISEILPKHMTIVDMGCYQAAQCYAFKMFDKYYGIDCYDMRKFDGYTPPLRFKTNTTEHFQMTIQDFLDKHLSALDLDNAYFIASAVPDFKATERLFNETKNCMVAYPGQPLKIKGVFSAAIKDAVLHYREVLSDREGI